MPSIVSQSSEARLLQEGINAVASMSYNDKPRQYSAIFETKHSSKAYEVDVSLSGTGLAGLIPEGTSVGYDAEKQDFLTTYTHDVYGLGTIITMQAQMNNLYRDLIMKSGEMLKRSLVQTDEQLAADVINSAYTDNIGDGVPLFSVSHVLGKGGTFANRFAAFTPFSRSALEDALISIDDFRDGANLYTDVQAVSIHIPRQLRYDVARVLKSMYEPNSANTATINPMYDEVTPHVNNRFSTTTDWFLKTDSPDGFTRYVRFPEEYIFETDNDFGTSNYRHKGMLYNSYGLTDPRAAWGSGT